MKKKVLMFLSVIMLMTTSLVSVFAISFSDLPDSHWAYSNIMALAERQIINGYENGTYQPERAISRGEFLKLVMTTLYNGNDYFETNNFNFGHWATPYAIEAAQLGYLMDGTSIDNLNNTISRLEMVHILAKVCIDNRIASDEIKEIKFSDVQALDETSLLYIEYVTQNGLINGYTDNTFKPDKSMTRAEVATLMNRFLNLIG